MIDEGVPVKTGGACGGFLKVGDAIAVVGIGRIDTTEKGKGLVLDTAEVGEGEGDGWKATGRM